ncbi:glycosyltransferase family 4 protein [Niveispirillum sp.]|uniref:glycosyltransferase family 4 protein n=1 Tax=Niveispirillum sp. TaxID=1917217 RepID=UPI001B6D03C7|nr:glycosyltransferase family 4 protein [Niveispirillum sp.]MBP7336354.1 glycosyltransferase family 4 protein [Niveispirillum sp.]
MSDQSYRPFVLNWRLTELHGWGLVGVHTCLYLLKTGGSPMLISPSDLLSMRPQTQEKLRALDLPAERLSTYIELVQSQGKRLHLENATVLYALGDLMQPNFSQQPILGDRNVGVGAFTETKFSTKALTDARSYGRIVIHSNFNKQVLAEHGVASDCVFQGVDPTEVSPGPKKGKFGDRFAIFSGGKIEFRKGQDIVLRAFRAFQQRRPEALLVTAWANFWPVTALSMRASPLGLEPLQLTADASDVDIVGWMRANGLPENSYLNIGFLSRERIAPLLHECDLAVFPNRCEPGTNLVAMEAMACGVPLVLSANTGHLDLIGDDRTYVLSRQGPVPGTGDNTRYWGESDVEELVEAMEHAYQNRDAARARGLAGAQWVLNNRRWDQFAAEFVDVCNR